LCCFLLLFRPQTCTTWCACVSGPKHRRSPGATGRHAVSFTLSQFPELTGVPRD
jgi:hypothetical protein